MQIQVVVPANEVRWGHSIGQYPYVCLNNGLWALSLTVLVQFTSNLACALIGWIFINYTILGPVAKYLAPWWSKNGLNLRFLDISWIAFHSIHFKPSHCACWVGVQKCFHSLPPGQIFAPPPHPPAGLKIIFDSHQPFDFLDLIHSNPLISLLLSCS